MRAREGKETRVGGERVGGEGGWGREGRSPLKFMRFGNNVVVYRKNDF